jgi:hypothetical protein
MGMLSPWRWGPSAGTIWNVIQGVVDFPVLARNALDAGAILLRPRGRFRSVVEKLAKVERDEFEVGHKKLEEYARRILTATTPAEAMDLAREIAPEFLSEMGVTLDATLRWIKPPEDIWKAAVSALESPAPESDVLKLPGVQAARRCLEDLLLVVGETSWGARAAIPAEDMRELATLVALSDVLAFTAAVGLEDPALARRPTFAPLARVAWDWVVGRYTAMVDVVVAGLDQKDREAYRALRRECGKARIAELVTRARIHEAGTDEMVELLGDPLVGRYLGDVIEHSSTCFPESTVRVHGALDPETDRLHLDVRVDARGLSAEQALEARQRFHALVRESLPDIVVGMIALDLRISD